LKLDGYKVEIKMPGGEKEYLEVTKYCKETPINALLTQP
jgi:hypothetical protein